MGSFISTSKFCELPFRGEKFINFGNTISFDKKASDEEIITTIVNENCDRIQTTKEPTENEIYLLNEIYKKNPNLNILDIAYECGFFLYMFLNIYILFLLI